MMRQQHNKFSKYYKLQQLRRGLQVYTCRAICYKRMCVIYDIILSPPTTSPFSVERGESLVVGPPPPPSFYSNKRSMCCSRGLLNVWNHNRSQRAGSHLFGTRVGTWKSTQHSTKKNSFFKIIFMFGVFHHRSLTHPDSFINKWRQHVLGYTHKIVDQVWIDCNSIVS